MKEGEREGGKKEKEKLWVCAETKEREWKWKNGKEKRECIVKKIILYMLKERKEWKSEKKRTKRIRKRI